MSNDKDTIIEELRAELEKAKERAGICREPEGDALHAGRPQ